MNAPHAVRRLGPVALLALILAMVPGPPSAAAQAAPESAEARAHFEAGVAHAGAGDWEPALESFRASLALLDRARTRFNVAYALDRLERGPECVREIDRLLAREDVDPADREEAETLRRRWSSRLGTLVIRVRPEDAVVAVDGAPIEGEGAARRVMLGPGAARVEVRAPGYAAEARDVELVAGGERRLEVELSPAVLGSIDAASIGALRSVDLRPIDRATVRIVALRGAEAMRPASPGARPTVVPSVAHGSGVAVHPDGWILTARHVVEGSDHLVVLLPGETRPLGAVVAWRDPARDLAFVRVSEPVEDTLPLAPPPSLALGQAVDASGYPLDPTERVPNASSGQIGRPLNDGRLQISMALNPGNSGGPITADGHLIGIVSQGGDPGRGVQGVVVMEPVGPVVAQLARLLATPAVAPSSDPADELLVELIDAAEAPALVRRIARLREAAASPPADVRGALWALEGEATRRSMLREARAASPDALADDMRALFDEATRLSAVFAQQLVGVPTLAQRYAPLRVLAGAARGAGWDCGLGGECAGAPRDPRRGWLFDLTLAGGIAMDDDQHASLVEGAAFSALGLFHLGNIGGLDPLRFDVLVGAELSAGSWRSEPFVSFLADVGVRLAIGDPSYAVSVQLLYTPGVVAAETRWAFAYVAYRATLALQLGSFGIGLSWREAGRGADDTQRSLELLLSWGI